MKDLVAAKPWVVTSRPFQGVEHAADGIHHTTQQQPKQSLEGEHLNQRIDGDESQPAHKNIDARRDPARGIDPEQGQDKSHQSQPPDHAEQGPAPTTPQGEQANGGVGPGNEKINRGMVVLAQGNTPLYRCIHTVVQSAGGIQSDHGDAVEGKGHVMPDRTTHRPSAYQQQHRAQQGQQGAHAVGDGRPGAQPIIGISPRFSGRAAPGLCICVEHRRQIRIEKFVHIDHPNIVYTNNHRMAI